jgi:N-acetylmuramoyl-L-alanine amidase
VECLAKNVYYESAGESFGGRVAAAQVTVNRADGDVSKVCDVVYFKKVNPATSKKEAAFSWTLGEAWRAKGPINQKAYRECELIARAVLAGQLHSKFDTDVKHYPTTAVYPKWKNRLVVQIGHHLFYRGG